MDPARILQISPTNLSNSRKTDSVTTTELYDCRNITTELGFHCIVSNDLMSQSSGDH